MSAENGMPDRKRIDQLEQEIEEIKARLPRHSVPVAMLMELDDLEDELEQLKARGAHGTE